jgi:hypothetical protein
VKFWNGCFKELKGVKELEGVKTTALLADRLGA